MSEAMSMGLLPPSPEGQAQLAIAGVDGDPLRLEELVDKNALRELTDSSSRIFGLVMRVASSSGTILAGPAAPGPILSRLGDRGARVAADVLAGVLGGEHGAGAQTVVAPTGELFRVLRLEYDRRHTGWIVLGPYAAPASIEPPAALFAFAPDLDPGLAREAWTRVPRFAPGRVDEIAAHLGTVLEVMLFSGHKALVTSQMHIASIQESYRELCEKNERLEEAYERLKELDRLKSNFLATVSHELRTPLTSIMGYGEMLAEGVAGALNDEQRDFVETIRGKSEQLLGLIMSLLDLSKLENGTMPVRVSRLSLSAVIGEAVSTILPTAMKKNVLLETEVPPDLPPVLGDSDRLRQVFINLVDNAVKFTAPEGHVRLTARLTMARPAGEPGLVLVAPLRPVIEVRVADTGIGIGEAERDRVFDAFYQIDQSSTREYGGAGLGLAIVKRLIEAHQGSIHVEENEPHGTVFVVTLPAGRPSAVPPSRGGSMPPPRGGSIPPPSRGSLPPIFG
jgi:two-component system, NarL family, sensor histidine kinase BarA